MCGIDKSVYRWLHRRKGATPVTAYELKNYNQDLYQGKLYAEELCVAQNDVALQGYTEDMNAQCCII